MATGDSLFCLTRLIAATDVKLSARCENGRKQILAFVTESGHLTLYYKPTPDELPFMKIIPWFSDSVKRIAALAFDPSGTWLLVAGHDGTIHIVPALSLADPAAASDHRWSTTDVTSVPTRLSDPTAPDQNCRISRPTAIAWWQCGLDCQHVAVVGTDRGDIAFVSLTAGHQVGLTYVRARIARLHVCQDNSLDNVFLLVTSDQRGQWRLLLEQRTTGYVWPLDNINNKPSDFSSSQSSVDQDLGSRVTVLPTARSRLQGLKQLSVEKLASLRQRLAETRTKGALDKDIQLRRGSNSSSSDESQSRMRKTSTSSEGADWSATGPLPDRLGPQVGETFLQPQYARGRYLLSGYYAPNSILTIHSMNLEVVPLFVHKLAPLSGDILVTDRFLFVTDDSRRNLTVVSSQFAEGRLDGDMDFNPESVIDSFNFGEDERIIAVYKRTDSSLRIRKNSRSKSSNSNHRTSSERRDKTGEGREKSSENRESLESREKSSENREKSSESRGKSSERSSKSRSKERELKLLPPFVLPKDVRDLNIEDKLVDTCVLVTTAGVYEVMLRRSAVEVFMELVLKRQELERAERLAQMFGLDLQQLFEAAGDLKLADKQFPQAISLYKLSRCRHLKSVLKFAAAGHSRELLAYIGMLLSTAGVDLTASERIHLANLAVMAYTDQVLRAVLKPKVTLTKLFLDFLRRNLHYDEVLAVNIAGQTGLWEILLYLASHRGLHIEVLDILVKILRSLLDSVQDFERVRETSPALDVGLWSCVSHPPLLQSLLARPQLARVHLTFVTRCLPRLDTARLERLAALLDPSAAVLRPALRRALAAKRRRHASFVSSDSYTSEADPAENDEVTATSLAEEILQVFLLVLLHLIRARTQDPYFDARLMGRVRPPSSEDELITYMETYSSYHCVPMRASLIGAGFCHVALVRNASVYTWGNAVQGCLGTGPTMSRYSLPQHVSLFPTLRVEVLSVSCGRQHTLALTTNGVYAWGSSQFGQLGVGEMSQSAWPVLVQRLAKERIVAISAGQYHSLALASDGRVFSWGWGVHGQLGHGSIEDCREPRQIRSLLGRVVSRVSAGHGHSLLLTAEGAVLACGSSIFGQLGCGTNTKATRPVKVEAIAEPVVNIATSYFHNLAVTASNRLYMWGASPQVLRLQAQAQKKARLMQQHCPPTPPSDASPPSPTSLADRPTPLDDKMADTPDDAGAGLNKSSPKDALESLSLSKMADIALPYADILSPVADMADMDLVVIPDSLVQATHAELIADVLSSASVEKEEKKVVKKSFTQSVHDYFTEHKISISDSSHSVGAKAKASEKGTEMAVILDRVNGGEVPLCTNVRTTSAGGYAIPTIVVSPTMEVKRVNKVKKAPAVKKMPQKPPAYLLDDGPLAHLLPQLVDTSLVEGQIVQISSGCHHSALVAKDGTLYTWGRNLDGQLGTGGRREVVIPTPLGAVSPAAASGSRGAIAGAIPPAACEKLRVHQVACGCEYTVALDSQSSKLWAWGCNSHAQLGKAPLEDGKCLDGRMVMIKTMKRVIKLPHGSQNSLDTPREVPNLPTSGITFRQSPRPHPFDQLFPLHAIEAPPYGHATLHYLLHRLHGHYEAPPLMALAVERENYQAAAKLAQLDRQYHLALAYQLKALAAMKRAPGDVIGAQERNVKLNAENLKCDESRVATANSDILVQKDQRESLLRDIDLNENVVGVDKCLKSDVLLIDDSLSEDNESRPKVRAKAVSRSDAESEVRVNGTETENGSSRTASQASSPRKNEASSCSTPDSLLSTPSADASEIHAFSIQGGNEEMSEGRQDLTSPSDTASPIAGEGESSGTEPSKVTADLENNCSNAGPNEHCSSLPQNSTETTDDVIAVTNDLGTLRIAETESAVTSDEKFVRRSLTIVEHYLRETEDEGCSMTRQVLQRGMEFWVNEGLPMERLEELLTRQLDKLFYPLGLLLFSNSDDLQNDEAEPAAMLNHLSTRFCLQLCSALTAHINENKSHPEYIELLANAASLRSDSYGSYPTNQIAMQTPEQLVEAILAKLAGSTSSPYVSLSEKTINAYLNKQNRHDEASRLFVFSCGHHFSAAQLRDGALTELCAALPNTARVMRSLFDSDAPSNHLACPQCVVKRVQAMADKEPMTNI